MSDNLLSLAGWYILPNVSPLLVFPISITFRRFMKHQYVAYSPRPSSAFCRGPDHRVRNILILFDTLLLPLP